LKVTTENIATREVMLTVEPDAERVDRAKRRAARAISRVRPVPGFRPGRAPLTLVERVFGSDLVLNEALSTVAEDIFRDALQEANIEPYDTGQFEIESEDPLQLKIRVSLRPVVDLGDYRSIRVEPEPEVTVTEQMIDEEIDALREQSAEYQPVERPVLMGDQVVLRFSAAVDGETVLEEDAYEILVDHEREPIMLVETLLGMNAGESAERNMEFPEDYSQPQLAGKYAEVRLTVNQVREKVLPDVDDEFAKSAGDYETVGELRAKIREELQREMEDARETRQRDKAVQALLEHATIEYPAAAVDRELDLMIEQEKSRLRGMGFEWESYLRMIRRTEEQLRNTARPQAELRLKQRLALHEFAMAEGLEIEEPDVDEELDRLASQYGGDDTQAFKERLVRAGASEGIRNDLLGRKTIEHLVALFTGQLDTEPAEDAADAPPSGEEPAEEIAAAGQDASTNAPDEVVSTAGDDTEPAAVGAEPEAVIPESELRTDETPEEAEKD